MTNKIPALGILGLLLVMVGGFFFFRSEGRLPDGVSAPTDPFLLQPISEMGLAQVPDRENAAPIYRILIDEFRIRAVKGNSFEEIRRRFSAEIHRRYGTVQNQSRPIVGAGIGTTDNLILKRFLLENEAVFEKVEAALELPTCQYGDYTLPVHRIHELPGTYSDGLRISRALVQFVSLKSLWAFESGDMEEAIRWNAAGFRMMNQMDRDLSFSARLVHTAIAGILVEDLKVLVSVGGVPAKAWKSILMELEEIRDPEKIVDVLQEEMTYSNIYLAGVKLSEKDAGERRKMEATRQMIENLGNRLIQSFEDRAVWAYQFRTDLKALTNSEVDDEMAEMTTTTYVNVLNGLDGLRVSAEQGMVGIALSQYRDVHDTYPGSLEELTPDFLREMPIDPFSNQPYVYRVVGTGYVLYSFGANGKNDRGRHDRLKGDLVWSLR